MTIGRAIFLETEKEKEEEEKKKKEPRKRKGRHSMRKIASV